MIRLSVYLQVTYRELAGIDYLALDMQYNVVNKEVAMKTNRNNPTSATEITLSDYRSDAFEVKVCTESNERSQATSGNIRPVIYNTDKTAPPVYTIEMVNHTEDDMPNQNNQVTALRAPQPIGLPQRPGTVSEQRPRPKSQQGPSVPVGQNP